MIAEMQTAETLKTAAGYKEKQGVCANCVHFVSDSIPLAWMVQFNENLDKIGSASKRYDLSKPECRKEIKPRCARNGMNLTFPVKRSGSCDHQTEISG